LKCFIFDASKKLIQILNKIIMKKNLLAIICAVLISSFSMTTNAQLPNGCIGPDFTATDLNGNTVNLYSILNQGKTVFMDISATWCGPCWSYHNTGALENLYNQYGPPGTNELMVLFVEGDGSTNTACLYGPTGCNSSTQGDWVTGTPYPIIDNATIANQYQIGYYPTIYMITPDRICRENSQISTASHYAAMQQYAITAIAGNDGGLDFGCGMNDNVTGCSAGVNLSVRLFNYSTSPLTSATITVSVNSVVQQTIPWTGNLATYAYAIVNITGVTGNVGSNTAQVSITGINGGTDTRASNDNTNIPFTIFSNVGGTPASQSFASAAFPPTSWMLYNGGSSATWGFSTAGYNGAGSAKMDFWNSPQGDIDILTLPPMDFSSYGSGTLTFDHSHKQYASGYNDNLKVKISTNCGTTWQTVFNKTGSQTAGPNNLTTVFGYTGNLAWTPSTAAHWLANSIDLSSFLGNSSVFVMFEANSGWGNNLYIDNVNFNFTTGISTVTVPVQFNLFPNPAGKSTTVSFTLQNKGNVTVNVVNALGQVVQTVVNEALTPAEYQFNINTENLSKGIYSVKILSADGVSASQLIVE
jgi:thiol-disulfide isomerase/thioredoxin